MKHWFRNLTIYRKMMVAFLLTGIIPTLLIGITIYNFASDSLEEASMEFTSVFNSQIVSNLNQFIEEYNRVTKSLLVDEEVITTMYSDDEDIYTRVNQQVYLRKVLMRLQILRPDIKGIGMISGTGRFYQSASEIFYMNYTILQEQEWFQRAMNSPNTLYVSEAHNGVYYEDSPDRILVSICRKIYDYAGKYIGVILIDLNPNDLIVLNDNFLLARNNYDITIQIENSEDKLLYDSDVLSGRITWKEALERVSALDGKNLNEYLILTNSTEDGKLNVRAMIPRESLLRKIRKIFYLTISIIILIILLSVCIAWFFSRRIAKPILQLQESMIQVEEGNYQVLIPERGQDEIGSLIHSYNNMVNKIRILIEDVYLAQIKQKNAQYLALQTQINPHMLYNTLESIRMTALMQGDDDTADMIKKLSRMLRMALDRTSRVGTVQDEIEYTEAYVDLIKIRYRDRFSMSVNISEELRKAFVLQLVFQPIVENCIEHAFKGRTIPLHLQLTGSTQNDYAEICFEDDGRGMNADKVAEIREQILQTRSEHQTMRAQNDGSRISIGLVNIAERLRIFYGLNSSMEIESEKEQGTRIRIRFPLKGTGEDVSGSDSR